MVTNNAKVIEAWKAGKAAKSHNGNLSTDGDSLYSYRMQIGKTDNGAKIALNVRGEYRYSATTSKHASMACHKADKAVNPVCSHSWRYFPD